MFAGLGAIRGNWDIVVGVGAAMVLAPSARTLVRGILPVDKMTAQYAAAGVNAVIAVAALIVIGKSDFSGFGVGFAAVFFADAILALFPTLRTLGGTAAG